jgi:CheY-like chemotaxis protein
VLLVEDDPFIGELLRRHVMRLGHEVTLHAGSRPALGDFCSRPHAFDLLITDNTMPGMSGLELVREIHKVRPDLPVLMISGLGEHAAADLAALGIRRILPKPHPHEQLVEAIRELLG